MFKFQKLNVWVKAKDYNKKLVLIANKLPNNYKFSFSDQLIRASLSITNNIAEGCGRLTIQDQKHFYVMSKGSVYETVNILIILLDLNLVSNNETDILIEQADEICKMLSGLINK